MLRQSPHFPPLLKPLCSTHTSHTRWLLTDDSTRETPESVRSLWGGCVAEDSLEVQNTFPMWFHRRFPGGTAGAPLSIPEMLSNGFCSLKLRYTTSSSSRSSRSGLKHESRSSRFISLTKEADKGSRGSKGMNKICFLQFCCCCIPFFVSPQSQALRCWELARVIEEMKIEEKHFFLHWCFFTLGYQTKINHSKALHSKTK